MNIKEQKNIVTEYLEHNKALEQSPEFQKIEQEVDRATIISGFYPRISVTKA